MIHLKRKRTIHWMIAIPLLLQLGCAANVVGLPQLPRPPSEQLRTHYGTIGVVSVNFLPEVEILRPAKGWASGCGREAVIMTAIWAVAPLAPPVFLGDPKFYLIWYALTPLAALGGCIHGAYEAPPAAKVEMAQEELNKYVHAGIEIQEKMRDQFLQVAKEQTHYAFVVLKDQGPATPDEELRYDSLADQGIDTVIEIGVLKFGLAGASMEANPSLSLFMTLRTRLIRIADGELLYDVILTYESEVNQTLDVWAANGAQLFREELGPCYPTLVDKVVEEVFLLYLPSSAKTSLPRRLFRGEYLL